MIKHTIEVNEMLSLYLILGLILTLVLVNIFILGVNKWIKFKSYKLTGAAYYILSFIIIFIVGTLLGTTIICRIL